MTTKHTFFGEETTKHTSQCLMYFLSTYNKGKLNDIICLNNLYEIYKVMNYKVFVIK